MKTLVITTVLASALLFNSSANADSCLDKHDVDGAYKGQVEAALINAGYKTVSRTNINATVTPDQDIHDPEYNVLLTEGGAAHVTCDDSGDDQCGCEVTPIADLKKYTGEVSSPLSNLNPNHEALPSADAALIKSFLEKCAVHKLVGDTDYGTVLKTNCVDGNTSITESYDKVTALDTISINTLQGEFFVFGYDNTQSDGGDLTDVGVYDENGTRIGYQVAPFLLAYSLDSLAALVGIDSTKLPVVTQN